MKWLKWLWFEIKFLHWRIMLKKYQFEETSLDPISSDQVVKIIWGNYQPKSYDSEGLPIEYEEIIEIIFPGFAFEKIPATEINRKYAAAIELEKNNQPKP